MQVIEKNVNLPVPLPRVWRAISDRGEFGQWFRANLGEGEFRPGEAVTGNITYPGYEHLVMTVVVSCVEPQRLLSFRWHPYAIDPNVDYSREQTTLVEFRLAPSSEGTRVTITEGDFAVIPEHRRDEAFRMNDGGWTEQVENLRRHLLGTGS